MSEIDKISNDSIRSSPSLSDKRDGRGKKEGGLRKGKWTMEEEKFANKIIEAFNAGCLNLGEEAKGITLRAYLAAKLDCDPMRITKKYTGASCLGKKVYHYDPKGHSQAAEAMCRELDALERQFRQKLDQMNRKRNNEGNPSVECCKLVSTPAIDALVQEGKPKPAPNSSEHLSPVSPSHMQSLANYPGFFINNYNPQVVPAPYYPFAGMSFYNPFFGQDKKLQSNQYQAISPDRVQYPQGSPELINQYHPIYHHPYFYQGHYPPGFNGSYNHFFPQQNPNPSESAPAAISLPANVASPNDLQVPIERESKKRDFDSITNPASIEITEPTKVARIDEVVSTAVEPNSTNSRISATSSLIGFINQLQKISSQENLLDYFDSQKSLGNLGSDQSSPGKLPSRESVENLMKLLSPTITLGQ